MRVGPRWPGGVAEAVAPGAPGIPVEVGAAGSKAARTASEAGGLAAAGAGAAFFVEAVALEDFLAELDFPVLLVFALELLLEDLKSLNHGGDLDFWVNRDVPPNDGGISLGQAALAAFAAKQE